MRFQADDNRLSVDQARLLPRARVSAGPFLERRRMERGQAEALSAALMEAEATMPQRSTPVPSPGELRGVPVIGHGGASPGTSPESSIAKLDRDLDRKRRAADLPIEPMVGFAA